MMFSRNTALMLALLLPACSGNTNPSNPAHVDASTPLVKGGASDSGPSSDGGAPPCTATGYQGDELCLAPPAQGIQIHYGPKSYSAEDMKPFLLQPHQEMDECVHVQTPNDTELTFAETHVHLRTDAPTLLASAESAPPADPTACSQGGRLVVGGAGPSTDLFDTSDPDDADLGMHIPAHAALELHFHFVNDSDQPMLREAWINLVAKDGVTTGMGTIELLGGLTTAVPPKTTQVVTGTAAAPQDLRIEALEPYFHEHTRRLTAYKVAGGSKTKILEAYDAKAVKPVYFDTAHTNPSPDADAGTQGAFSGLLQLKQGDQIEWECEVVNDLDTPIGFSQSFHTGEMCVLFGIYSPSDGRGWSAVQ